MGIERAAKLALEVDKDVLYGDDENVRTAVSNAILALSPAPSYLDRVRNEAVSKFWDVLEGELIQYGIRREHGLSQLALIKEIVGKGIRAEATTAALEQAAQAMCSLCAQQIPIRMIEGSMRLWHLKEGGEPHQCEAVPIRKLTAAIRDDKKVKELSAESKSP